MMKLPQEGGEKRKNPVRRAASEASARMSAKKGIHAEGLPRLAFA